MDSFDQKRWIFKKELEDILANKRGVVRFLFRDPNGKQTWIFLRDPMANKHGFFIDFLKDPQSNNRQFLEIFIEEL